MDSTYYLDNAAGLIQTVIGATGLLGYVAGLALILTILVILQIWTKERS